MLLDVLRGILWLDDGRINNLHITDPGDKKELSVEMTIEVL